MPGQNLQKLSKEELEQLRTCVRKIYFADSGFTAERMREVFDDRECDKLIDSLLPDTVEKLRAQGIKSGFISRKKFFLPAGIYGLNGKMITREDTGG